MIYKYEALFLDTEVCEELSIPSQIFSMLLRNFTGRWLSACFSLYLIRSVRSIYYQICIIETSLIKEQVDIV
jgi:hypothetical protein